MAGQGLWQRNLSIAITVLFWQWVGFGQISHAYTVVPNLQFFVNVHFEAINNFFGRVAV